MYTFEDLLYMIENTNNDKIEKLAERIINKDADKRDLLIKRAVRFFKKYNYDPMYDSIDVGIGYRITFTIDDSSFPNAHINITKRDGLPIANKVVFSKGAFNSADTSLDSLMGHEIGHYKDRLKKYEAKIQGKKSEYDKEHEEIHRHKKKYGDTTKHGKNNQEYAADLYGVKNSEKLGYYKAIRNLKQHKKLIPSLTQLQDDYEKLSNIVKTNDDDFIKQRKIVDKIEDGIKKTDKLYDEYKNNNQNDKAEIYSKLNKKFTSLYNKAFNKMNEYYYISRDNSEKRRNIKNQIDNYSNFINHHNEMDARIDYLKKKEKEEFEKKVKEGKVQKKKVKGNINKSKLSMKKLMPVNEDVDE